MFYVISMIMTSRIFTSGSSCGKSQHFFIALHQMSVQSEIMDILMVKSLHA